MSGPFHAFAQSIQRQNPLRAAITAAWRRPETECLPPLIEQAKLTPARTARARTLATRLVEALREKTPSGGVEGLIHEYALSSQEGVALMCLAEALLRIPDDDTRDALIRDKIGGGDWRAHLGHSPSLFVNAATWGLMLTGRLTATSSEQSLSAALVRLIGRGGEPLIRTGVNIAMRLMGEQFVAGQTIGEALDNAREREELGFRHSYDMLGEAAVTAEQAMNYMEAYEASIHAIGEAARGRGIYEGPGISIKLSALHPRYGRAQLERVQAELYPRLRTLALLARRYDIGLNIDAEEADRLEISLDLLERLCFEPELEGWNGVGFVVQAYQKRAVFTIDWLIDLARRSQRRLMVRLVKGAYWDGEIKRAQLDGLSDYPVFTRRIHTDVSYLACARRLLAAPDAAFPQFATHNALTLATIHAMAGENFYVGQYEFQCLHGMGEPLYEQVVGKISEGKLNRPCRVYAPVGTHETLLAYLVRRLLENGANTSFVNRIADQSISIQELVADPVASIEQMATVEGGFGLPHPRIPLPRDLYGSERANSSGIDMANEHRLASLSCALLATAHNHWKAAPMLGCASSSEAPAPVLNPSDLRDVVGHVQEATVEDVDNAIQCALNAAPIWQATPPAERAAILERAADLMEAEIQPLMGLLAREAGKTFANAIAEVREAVDFLRYYAVQARNDFTNDAHRPLGPVVCISPWNFPLAIFSGQVAAALAAGNPVLAKPAEQTPLVAAQAVRLMLEAGIPEGVLQLLPGRGETVGAGLVGDDRVKGVMFTGSTEVARLLQRNIAGRLDSQGRPIPLIAETGGQNAMIVDSSALTEQVVIDVVSSAFDSAGQRCSALRVLCLQEDSADRVIEMLKGAMAESRLGNPERLSVDIGPVIDAEAKAGIEKHIQAMRDKGRSVYQVAIADAEEVKRGTFVMPTLIELESFDELQREIFGPVLHVVRYKRKDIDQLIGQINASGYGLTLGVHTRIDETIAKVIDNVNAGNVYVNRNIVGAVVGVQPFGGEGLSGTGPKAGGPLYLYRLLSTRPADAIEQSFARGDAAAAPDVRLRDAMSKPLTALKAWADNHKFADLSTLCVQFAAQSQSGITRLLAGPTGERNSYAILPREHVLCLAEVEGDLLTQLAAVLAVGGSAVWPEADMTKALFARLPKDIQARIKLVSDWNKDEVVFDAVLHHGHSDQLRAVCQQVAKRAGAIVGVQGLSQGESNIALERLVIERALSVNTAAAGGNASLMTIG